MNPAYRPNRPVRPQPKIQPPPVQQPSFTNQTRTPSLLDNQERRI